MRIQVIKALGFAASIILSLHAQQSFADHKRSQELIVPIPLEHNQDPAKVALGERLFHDPRLSYNNTVSCAFCHNLTTTGQNNQRLATGVDGKLGELNTPTVYNSGFLIAQFWDGRVETLEEQIDGPINNPNEMGGNWESVVNKIAQDEDYQRAFGEHYNGVISRETISAAIGTFERSLITPNAPFDQYLRGDDNAISDDAKRGYDLFKEYGCISCHQGVAVGGNMFEKMGVLIEYFTDEDELTEADNGRNNHTGEEEDRFEFKVPSLRNVAKTAPYFHDGRTETLEEAVTLMAYHQLGRRLSNEERDLIVAFLNTLTGEFPVLSKQSAKQSAKPSASTPVLSQND